MHLSPSSAAAAAVILALALSACGSDNNPAAPTPTPTPTPTPPPPPPPANRAPTISSMTANPAFGVATLTAFAMTAAATDPDGDPVTFEWEFGDGTRGTGPALSKTYLTGGAATVTLTVSDGRGLSATDRRTITVGSLTGNWSGTIGFPNGQSAQATLSLVQTGGTVTGTFAALGDTGRIDPAQLGRIDSNGAIELRWKIDPFLDFTMRGQMDPTGTRISGSIFGSGFNGEPFVFDKR
jgi:hypothetical protein